MSAAPKWYVWCLSTDVPNADWNREAYPLGMSEEEAVHTALQGGRRAQGYNIALRYMALPEGRMPHQV